MPGVYVARRQGDAYYRFATSLTARDRERRYLAQLLADRDAAKEVRAFGLSSYLRARRARLWDERLARLRGVAGRQLTLSLLADLAATLVVVGALVAVVALTTSDDITLAEAGVLAATLVLIAQRLAVASSSAAGLTETALFIDDYIALIAAGAPPSDHDAIAPPSSLAVRAEGVTFTYQGATTPALRDVSIAVAPGEVVALVGENGSGKTTLAKLLAGLYLPQSGRVTWNEAQTGTPEAEPLRAGVAVIFQDFWRYSLPVRDNIALGRPERIDDREALLHAAAVAGAHDDIVRLPEGYETMLGPAFHGGTDLSLGQWQRLALARALFRDAPFVILDEPTAALDPQAEHDLFSRIGELLRDRGVLLISHRFSSVRDADRIHVLREGEIIETGTHEELIDHDGVYAGLFRLQAAPYRVDTLS